ncbi:MAG: glycosyltransferase family 2 protein [Candidatus Omnitrophica bacterium]|nr:glycosyltransferase family 2 protein [Candidatus Omnitrophota bacterium]
MSRISVILCCYNGAPWVGEALGSLDRQTMPRDGYEVVFVNDGSTDATEQAMAPYRARSNVQYLAHERNQGLVASCNQALEASHGEYIVRLDADDTFEPPLLERMSTLLREGQTDLVYSDRYEWSEKRRARRLITLGSFNLFDLTAVGTMMRRDLVLSVGGYRELFWEEYDLYLRYLLRSGRAASRVPEPLFTYRRHHGSMTSDPAAVRRGWEELQRVWPASMLERFGRCPDSTACAEAAF